MSQQNCTPARIFSPAQNRYLLLGLSIANFNGGLGWGAQNGDISINLVNDTCPGNKLYYDGNLNLQTWTGPDPGPPNDVVTGNPIYIRLDNFEWAGIIQSFELQNSEQGEIYVLKATGPTNLLRNTQLIVGNYAGGLNISDVAYPSINYQVPNVANCYGFAESFGTECPLTEILGGRFGSPAGAFGGANITQTSGMSYNQIRDAAHLLFSAIPKTSNQFSPYGRIIFPGSDISGHGILIPDFIDINTQKWVHEYLVDLSSLPVAPDYYRIAGPTISLLDFIEQVCSESGCSWYPELIPIRWGDGILKVIKIRVRVLSSQATLGQITEFLSDSDGANNQSVGIELVNEDTSCLVVGGQQENIYQAINASLIENYWGLDSNGNAIEESTFTDVDDNVKFKFIVNIDGLNTTLHRPLDSSVVTIYEDELRAALEGEDSWLAWQASAGINLAGSFAVLMGDKLDGLIDVDKLDDFIDAIDAGDIDGLPKDFINIAQAKRGVARDKFDLVWHDYEAIFEFVNNYAQNYFGKQFMVRVPYTCVKREPDSFQILTTESPNDSGWTDYETILDLPHPSLFTDFFGEENGKIRTFVTFGNAATYDYSHLSTDQFGIFQNKLYLKADIDTTGYVYLDVNTFFSPRAIISLPDKVYQLNDEGDFHRHAALISHLIEINMRGRAIPKADVDDFIDDKMQAILDKAGNEIMHFGFSPRIYRPSSAAIPLRSNVLTYGPWYYGGYIGGTRIENDGDLVPWNWGTTTNMNLAGFLKASQGVVGLQHSEMGYVTIPGYPELSLGAELRHGAPGVIESRQILTNNTQFNDGIWVGVDEEKWTGLSGPNITNINIEVGQAGVQTTYSMRTYTPKIGRFAQANISQLQRLGQENLRQVKALRLANYFQNFSLQTKAIANFIRKDAEKHKDKKFSPTAKSPSSVVIGQNVKSDDVDRGRVEVGINKYQSVNTEFTEDYQHKAISSLDSILRPVSKNGNGDLPRYAISNVDPKLGWTTRYTEPPITIYTPVTITNTYLDPVADIDDPKYHTGNTHHDIEILAHGEQPPETSLILPVAASVDGENETYTGNDYRFHAIKGPLIIHGWGYDIDGKPIPNEADESAEDGIFETSGLKDRFINKFMERPETWPVAPVDLRFDRERSCWVTPPPFRLVRVKLTSDVSEDTSWQGTGWVIDGRPIETEEGVSKSREDKIITVYSPFYDELDPTFVPKNKTVAKNGDIIVCYFDTFRKRYYLFATDRSTNGSTVGGKVKWARTTEYPVRQSDDLYYVFANPLGSIAGGGVGNCEIAIDLPIRHPWFSIPQIEVGQIIAYAEVEDSAPSSAIDTCISGSAEYVCVSDYSDCRTIFYGKILEDSYPGNQFMPFTAKINMKGVDDAGVTLERQVKNPLSQPVLAGQNGFFYRNLFYDNDYSDKADANEWYLLQADFCKVCVVSDINITSTSNGLAFQIKKKGIYSEAAWTDDEKKDAPIYVDSIDTKICITIPSSSNSGCTDFKYKPKLNIGYPLAASCPSGPKFFHCGLESGGGGSQSGS